DVGGLSLSPDGKQLAFVASVTQPVNSYTQPDLWIVDLTPNAKPRNLTEKFDFDIDDGPFGDNAPPRADGGAFRFGHRMGVVWWRPMAKKAKRFWHRSMRQPAPSAIG